MRNEKGNTLIELMVVVVILGVSLAISAPGLNGYVGSMKIERCMEMLATNIDLARQRAVAHHNPVEIIFDEANAEYSLHDDTNGNAAVDGTETLDGPYKLPRGVSMSGVNLLGDGRMIFTSSGMLKSGQGGTITVGDEQHRYRTLEVCASGMLLEN